MKPGPKPKGKVKIHWSPEFAYAIGLLTADGNLSKDGRHIDLTSKDKQQVETFKRCLKLNNKVTKKKSGKGNIAFHIQFGDVLFYSYLISIGLMPAKSKILSTLSIPKKYIIDFARGLFDGDGYSYSFYDSVFRNSYRFYSSFASASPKFLDWLRAELYSAVGIKGAIDHRPKASHYQLKYAKKETVMLVRALYYRKGLPYLKRKHLKIQRSIRIIKAGRSGETW